MLNTRAQFIEDTYLFLGQEFTGGCEWFHVFNIWEHGKATTLWICQRLSTISPCAECKIPHQFNRNSIQDWWIGRSSVFVLEVYYVEPQYCWHVGNENRLSCWLLVLDSRCRTRCQSENRLSCWLLVLVSRCRTRCESEESTLYGKALHQGILSGYEIQADATISPKPVISKKCKIEKWNIFTS